MIRRLVICLFFSLLSVLHAAPIPNPPNHGDYVSVKPSTSTSGTSKSSSASHPGVVVGGPNQFDKYQVAVVSHNPPDKHQEKLTNIHPSSALKDAANSRIGTGAPMTYHASNINPLPKVPSLSQTETSNLQNKIKTNSGQATWPARNQASGSSSKPTLKNVATTVVAAQRLSKSRSPSPSGDKQTPQPKPATPAGPSRQPSLLQRLGPAPNNPPPAASNQRGAISSNVQASRKAARYNPMSTSGRRGGKP